MTTATRPSRLRGAAAVARHQSGRLIAAAILVAAGIWLATLDGTPGYSSSQLSAMASKFRFERMQLTTASHARPHYLYAVEPPVHKIRAWISALGAAVGLTDADGNGLPDDSCLVDPRTRSVTVAPAPGTGARYQPFLLDPRPLRLDSTMTPMGCVPGDFDGDGTIDFIVYYTGRTPLLFLRKPGTPLGPAGFVHQELMPGAQRWTTDTITQADLDGDGHLDLIVGNYFPDGARLLDTHARSDPSFQMAGSLDRARNGGGVKVLRWTSATGGPNPSVHYQQVPAIPASASTGWAVAVGAADLTGNMLPDVYVANDFGPDHLLANESTPGHIKLTPVTGERGFTTPASKVLGRDSFKSMSAAFGDLTGKGRFDIFVSNITEPFALMESNFVWVNNGHPLKPGAPAPFADESEQLGMARSGWGWDAKIGDFANDGRNEVIQATGFLKGTRDRWAEVQELSMGNDQLTRHLVNWPSFQPGDELDGQDTDPFYARAPSGRYVDLGSRVGLGAPMVSRGIALGDVNGDGRLDFAIANQWNPSYLFLNHSPRHAFLGLDLLLPPNGERGATHEVGFPARGLLARPAIGATVTLTLPGGHRLIQQVDGGNGHAGFSAPELLFGLGAHPPQTVVANVAWRDGDGVAHHASMKLHPGWHAVLLEQR
jgi:enediyne biosynthesis protein E4